MQSETSGNFVLFSISVCVLFILNHNATLHDNIQSTTQFIYTDDRHHIYSNTYIIFTLHRWFATVNGKRIMYNKVPQQIRNWLVEFTSSTVSRTSPGSDRMPENSCHPPTSNAYRRTTISKFGNFVGCVLCGFVSGRTEIRLW